MATGRTSGLLHHLRRAALLYDGNQTDGQLLESFVARRDEAAFEVLLRRHGPMVLGVCRRLLGDAHDAEDAFQATFLVLVRKAASVVPREMVGNWLYGVAYRTALEARSAVARRRAKERQVREMARPQALAEDVWSDLRPFLDQELNRLPDKYRVPVVLCDLEGKTRKEAARQLGWPEGTLSCRLARARVMLARRLAGHGLTLSGGLLGVMLSHNAAAASVPAPLAACTARAAARLAAGQAAMAGVVPAKVAALIDRVLRGMFMTKLKNLGAVLLTAGLIALGVTVAGYQTLAASKSSPSQEAPRPAGSKVAGGAEKLGLPKGAAPYQVLARVDDKGRIVVRSQSTAYRVVQVMNAAGQKVAYCEPVIQAVATRYAPEKVQVFDTTGKKIARKAVAKLLHKEMPALVSADGKKVDPLHLRVIKEGTPILILPMPKLPPQPAPAVQFLPAPAGQPGAPGGGLLPPQIAIPAPPAIAPPQAVPPAGGGGPAIAPPGGKGGGPAIAPPARGPRAGGPAAVPPGGAKKGGPAVAPPAGRADGPAGRPPGGGQAGGPPAGPGGGPAAGAAAPPGGGAEGPPRR